MKKKPFHYPVVIFMLFFSYGMFMWQQNGWSALTFYWLIMLFIDLINMRLDRRLATFKALLRMEEERSAKLNQQWLPYFDRVKHIFSNRLN